MLIPFLALFKCQKGNFFHAISIIPRRSRVSLHEIREIFYEIPIFFSQTPIFFHETAVCFHNTSCSFDENGGSFHKARRDPIVFVFVSRFLCQDFNYMRSTHAKCGALQNTKDFPSRKRCFFSLCFFFDNSPFGTAENQRKDISHCFR